MLRSKMATLLTIVSAMLISAGMTWQQRLLFIGGIAFGVVVEALPSLVDELKERVAEWRRFRQFSVKTKAAEPSAARFFLIKTSGNGAVELGEEVASENEAMVEPFRVGGSFAVVTEWKAQVDLATGVPVIKKEAVKSEKKVAHS